MRTDPRREIGDIALRGQPAPAGAAWLPPKSAVKDSELDLSRRLVLRDGREVTLRAITEADAPAIQRAFDHLSTESRYSRFLHHKRHLDPTALARAIRPRPGQDFVLVATVPQRLGIEIVGGAQYVRASASDDATCEFAITVAEDWRGCGLARELLTALLNRARRDHYVAMVGLVLADNAPMLALAHKLQFTAEPLAGEQNLVQVTRQLERRTARSASAMVAHRLKRVISGFLRQCRFLLGSLGSSPIEDEEAVWRRPPHRAVAVRSAGDEADVGDHLPKSCAGEATVKVKGRD